LFALSESFASTSVAGANSMVSVISFLLLYLLVLARV